MEYSYIGKRDEYRKAFYANLGKAYEFNIEPDTNELFLAFSVSWSKYPGGSGFINRAISYCKKKYHQSVKYLNITVEIEGRVIKQKILLAGHTKDWLLCSDLASDWYDIFIPVENSAAKKFTVKPELLDDKGDLVRTAWLDDFVVLAKPVFLKRQYKRNIVYITLESLTDIDYLKKKKLISNRTYQLYEQVFADFRKVKDAISQVDWTFPAAVSYHTGLLPSQHKMYHSERIKNKQDRVSEKLIGIAELLKKEGYVTFSANLGKLNAENGFANGIDCYYKPESSLGFIEYTGDDTWVLKKLELFKNNCFIHLHYDRLHHPLFSTTGPWSRIRTKENPKLSEDEKLLNPETYYESNLRMLLFEVNNIITYLKMNDLFRETIFIVTGDHGYDFGEWIDVKQETPLLESRLRVPYLINQKSAIDSQNASIRPFMEICDLLDLKLPEYYYSLPQKDEELSRYTFSESILKSKGHLYVLGIGDERYQYILYAYLDWDEFDIKSIEKEYVVEFSTSRIVKDPEIENEFVKKRKHFFELNAIFYKKYLQA